ncbi:hypothetical protein [Rhizobium leguminosarum]|uniref:hypothetical protein n=1 Tax=Rhizobium leguminosarum TaxID=384 RepID=UPI001C939B45|nr:hypothetical protein [Rhizobium leguminosarum]MBY5581852.1 hypothetical protein [Rhizobium leguminosarum]
MANLAAVNATTSPVLVQGHDTFDVSVSGTFVASLTVQRSKDQTTWFDVEVITAPAQKTGVSGSAWWYRVIATSYTSGTAVVDFWK